MLSFERQQLYHSKTKKGTNFVFQTPKVVFRATKVVSTIKLPCGFPRFPSLSVRSTHQGNHIETPQGGSSKGAASGLPPGLRPAPKALLRVGHAAPRPPWAAPPVLRSQLGHLHPVTRGKRASGLSTPAGGGQHSRASIGRDPRFHGYFLKEAPQAGATGVCETLCVLHTEGVSVECVKPAHRVAAVHTLVVWAGWFCTRGKGMDSAPAFAAFAQLKKGARGAKSGPWSRFSGPRHPTPPARPANGSGASLKNLLNIVFVLCIIAVLIQDTVIQYSTARKDES